MELITKVVEATLHYVLHMGSQRVKVINLILLITLNITCLVGYVVLRDIEIVEKFFIRGLWGYVCLRLQKRHRLISIISNEIRKVGVLQLIRGVKSRW